MEKICISGLKLRTIIGTLPGERLNKQEIILDLELFCHGKKAELSDDLADAVDYSAVEALIVEKVESSSFFLLEALTGMVGRTVLSFAGIDSCTVQITKPAASGAGALISYTSNFSRGEN